MEKAKQTKTSCIHTQSGNLYEISNSVEQIRDLMFDNFIKENTFLQFKFPDGYDLFVRKKILKAFMSQTNGF